MLINKKGKLMTKTCIKLSLHQIGIGKTGKGLQKILMKRHTTHVLVAAELELVSELDAQLVMDPEKYISETLYVTIT
jgi:hypothetical protein